MKTVLLSILIIMTINSFGQTKPNEQTQIDSINLRLDKFRTQHQTGTVLQVAAGLIIAATASSSQYNKKPYYVVGSLIGGVGTFLTITSYRRLRRK